MNIDRLSIRSRPRGWPLMHQNWGKLLFMHWPIGAELLRPLIPAQLSIDTFEGSAWIGVVPFTNTPNQSRWTSGRCGRFEIPQPLTTEAQSYHRESASFS